MPQHEMIVKQKDWEGEKTFKQWTVCNEPNNIISGDKEKQTIFS